MALVGKVQTRSFGVAPYQVLVVRCLLCGHKDEHVMPVPLADESGNKVVPMCTCYDGYSNLIQPVRIIPND